MEGRKYYRTLGLPLDTWGLIDEARSSRICREVLGKYPTDSEIVGWLLKLGSGRRIQFESEAETIQEALR